MISLKNVKKVVNKMVVLSNISCDILEGDFFVICCQNSGGKTTITKLISKIIKPDEGEVVYEDIDNDDIAVVYDNNESNTLFSNYEYLEFYSRCHGIKEDELKKRIDYYIDKYNLDNLKYANFDDLNRSSKKIIYLICALISNARIIVFDELYQHIFDTDRMIIHRIVEDIRKEKTIIAVCDTLDDYVDVATKVMIIDKGRVSMSGIAKDVFLQYGYKNYLTISYRGDIENISLVLNNISNIREYTYSEDKIDIVTYEYNKDFEILKALIENGINVNEFRREDKK